MTTTALKEAAQVGFPRDKIVGNWWACAEQDMVAAGEAALGYMCASFHGTGSNFPLIQEIGDRLQDEVKVRATIRRENPKQAVDNLKGNLDSLREHLVKRRAFLLEQEEIKTAGKFERSELK